MNRQRASLFRLRSKEDSTAILSFLPSMLLCYFLQAMQFLFYSFFFVSGYIFFTTTFLKSEEHGGVDILRGLLDDGVFNSSSFIHTHSHPDGWFQNSPSGYRWFHSNSNDKDLVKYFSTNYPQANIIHRILTKGKSKYVYYDLNGIKN